ncbi:PepSY-associated TM helix domain-containing protein [soil metagenome]
MSSISTGTIDAAQRLRRAFWLKHLHQWHWISSAICLIGMLGFAITGFTLNHAGSIESHASVTRREARLPDAVLRSFVEARAQRDAKDKSGPVPAAAIDWLAREWSVDAGGRSGEWSADEVYVALARPGGDAWVSFDTGNGDVQYERTDRGVVAFLNDLHKGRNTGAAWSWFIDVFAAACLVFCVTGLFLLQLHAGGRAATWPMVGLGIVIPVVLALLFIH